MSSNVRNVFVPMPIITYPEWATADGCEPLMRGHHAFEWALAAALADPDLTDSEGRCIIPRDAVVYVTPSQGEPYAQVYSVFDLDQDGNIIDVRPINDKRLYRRN